MTRTRHLLPWLVAALALAGCVVGVDPEVADRNVPGLVEPAPAAQEPPPQRPATREDLWGTWTSVQRSGTWAAAGLHFLYVFNPDSTWHSSVVVANEDQGHSVLVLRGRWSLVDALLELGAGAPPQQARVAGDHLFLESDLGTLELRRLDLPLW